MDVAGPALFMSIDRQGRRVQRSILLYLIAVTGGLLSPWPMPWQLAVLLLGIAAPLALCRRVRPLAAVLAGLAWASVHVAAWLAALPVPDADGNAVPLRGRVVSFARADADGYAFALAPPARNVAARLAAVKVAVRGYHGTEPRPGAWCDLRVSLRAPRGLANAGQRDRERAYAARRIGATARVVAHPANVCLPIAAAGSLDAWRWRLARAIDEAVVEPHRAAVIRALAVADRSGLVPAQWTLVRTTGTAHLLAISGLHVALSAALAFAVCRVLAGIVGWYWQGYPALRLAWIGACAAALLYAGLAGFGVPARRAALMVALATFAALRGRRAISLRSLLVALAVMVTLDPFALLGEGLWLSFCAVAVLLWQGLRAGGTPSPWQRAGRAHVALAIGMAPLLGAVFGAVPVIAPFTNFLAVPWCSVLVVPLVLAGIALMPCSPPLAALAWDMAARLWGWLERLLEWAAAPQLELALGTLAGPALAPLALGLVLFALPRGLGLRRLALLLCASLFAARTPPPAPGAFEVDVLDVGQGLAVLVRTRQHVLLYDAGPRWWRSGDDAGRAVVVPALRRQRIAQLDTLVVSHTDNDHVGGLASVLAAVPADALYAPPRAVLPGRAPVASCAGAADWVWDGVRFRWLDSGVAGAAGTTRNDGSCVLLVESAHGRLLLSGDIERRAEAALLARHGAELAAAVLVVPHHGSSTSSSPAFLAAVAPEVAIVTTGFRNRYGLPDAAVVARYRAIGTRILDTARDGAVRVRFDRAGIAVDAVRHARPGFWARRAATPLADACDTFDC